MRPSVVGLVLVLAFLASNSWAGTRPIVGCHDAVLTGDVGVLQNDLDCSGAAYGTWGVTLAPGAVLDLAGHAIRNGFGGVWCQGKCMILGPGEISGTSELAIHTSDKTTVSDLLIQDTGGGIFPPDAGDVERLRAVRVKLRNVTMVRVGTGVRSGVYGWQIVAKGVTVADSGFGLYADGVRGKDVTLTGNAENGVRATKATFVDLVATGNGAAGVEALYVRLMDSTVTGNDGYGDGRDVIGLAREPMLVNTTCGRSAAGDLSDYDICTND